MLQIYYFQLVEANILAAVVLSQGVRDENFYVQLDADILAIVVLAQYVCTFDLTQAIGH